MKFAILGTRGVPASYGGFETFAEELGQRLCRRGHEVWVYTRPGFVDPDLETYKGMHLISLPAIRTKHLETLSHTFFSAIDAANRHFDAVLICNAANAPFLRILQGRGIPVALNVDGLERKRRKWGLAGRTYYKLCERLAACIPDAVITDARVIERYYRRLFRTHSRMIPYGADLEAPKGMEILTTLGISPGQYGLYVSRFEPENNPDLVAEAWLESKTTRPLVMLGDAPYAGALKATMKKYRGDRILMPGAIYGQGYRELLFNCRLYIHATEVGGTHPALVEAMGAGRPVLVLDTPENREVVGDAALPYRFSGDGLVRALEILEDGSRLEELGARAEVRARVRYSWDAVTDAYEELLEGLC